MSRAAASAQAGAAALLLAAGVAMLLSQDMVVSSRRAELMAYKPTTKLTTYMPPSLRWPGWVAQDRPPQAGAAPPPAEAARPELVGAPEDWRDNINYGFHPAEAKVPEDEAQKAMETLMNAGMQEGVTYEPVPAAEALKAARRQKVQSQRITEARVEASKGASPQQLAKIMNPNPCDENPSDLRCSEYPTGWFTPEYDKAKYGSSIKVPNGAIRNVEGTAEDTDGRRRSAPESEFNYEVRSLTANYEDQESPQRRSKDGYHDRIDAEDPMGRLEVKQLVPLHTYEKAKYGPGIKALNPERAADQVHFPATALRSRERPAPEYWKARYGAYGVYPFQKGDSDDTMSLGAPTKPHPLGQEYFKAKYGPHGYAMFDLDQAADHEAARQVRLPKPQTLNPKPKPFTLNPFILNPKP